MRGDEPSKEGSTDDRDEKDGLVTPLRPVERKCHGRTDDGHQQPQNHKRQAHGTQQPSERSGAAVAHPTDSPPLTLFSYPFCHDTTLQHHRLLVHLQNRFQAMSYSGDHETSHLCPYTFEKGAQGSAGRAAFQRRLRPASLPDTPGERRWRERAADSRKSWVR